MSKEKYKYLRYMPANYYYWCFVLQNDKDMKAFLTKGNERQIKSLYQTIKCLKKKHKEKYISINGKEKERKIKDVYSKFKR